MGRSRPINRRPWRRPPWRKSRRSALWVDGASWGAFDRETEETPWETPCIAPLVNITCDAFPATPDDTRSTARVVWSGAVDADFIDDNKALIERIVGDIEWRINYQGGAPAAAPVVRWGLLAIEENEPSAYPQAYQSISLFQNSHLAQFEWMHLEQVPHSATHLSFVDDQFAYMAWHTSHIDVRTRRSLGRRDTVVLLASYLTPAGADSPPSSVEAVQMYPLLRVIQTVK